MCCILVQVVHEDLVDRFLADDVRVLEGKPVQLLWSHHRWGWWNKGCAHDFGQSLQCVSPCCLQVSTGRYLEDPFRCGVVC